MFPGSIALVSKILLKLTDAFLKHLKQDGVRFESRRKHNMESVLIADEDAVPH